MVPNIEKEDTVFETHVENHGNPPPSRRTFDLVYKNFVIFGYLYGGGLYGLYLCITAAKLATILFSSIVLTLAYIGVTVGAHRLWSHKAFKAKMPLQIILMVLNSIAYQNTVLDWVRDHRMHHKYSDTDADPHNPSRGFFFAHIGWLLVRKHEEVKKRKTTIDLSDVYSNPVLLFQRRYAVPLIAAVCFVLPTAIPMYFWGETLNVAWHANIFRYITNMNMIFLLNSAAHTWGYRPYDKSMRPSDNPAVNVATLGEGKHNFHHTFPWDYRHAEQGSDKFNLGTPFIHFFTWIGWAYDLKTVSLDVVKKRALRTGDGTYLDNNLTDKKSVEI